ncbi:MAG: hypothetical protein JWR80_4425 [Bradyrhizobium sp.]|nr:hypothetical protein [Bradyrhizobium sp.]
MLQDKLLLVGSMPFDSAEEVLIKTSNTLGGHLDCMPDGEVLDRRYWILRMAFQVFNGHPALETTHYPAAQHGSEKLIPTGLADMWQFRLRPGIKRISFDMLGWRLGYAKDAQNSFAIFSALKREGKIRSETRFQVSLPAVNSVVNPMIFGTDQRELEIVRAGFQEALLAETEKICQIIPPNELAIQFDCSFEITDVYGATGLPIEGAVPRNAAQFGPLSAAVASGAQLGFHLCFGTFGGWPRFAPESLDQAVALANAIAKNSSRPIDWMHIPTLDETDEAFYAPLADLDLGEARIYLGLIHSMDSFAQRFAIARRFISDFGLAGYCGFGRLDTAEIEGALADHLRAVEIATGAFQRDGS